MKQKEPLIPRTVWILWYQGESRAPFVVKNCIRSWRDRNPSWDVVVLDSEKLKHYIDSGYLEGPLQTLSMNHQSDLIRLRLLSEWGGVWADATTFCLRPLDEWIDECSASGFFAFHGPGKDRLLSSWFLAATANSPIVRKLHDRLFLFFTENRLSNRGPFKKWVIRHLKKLLNKKIETTKYWFSPFVTKVLKVYPYFAFHYLFERLVATDPESREIWDKTIKVSSDGPHRLLREGLLSPLRDPVKREIDAKSVPLYKLTWKYNHDEYSPGSILHYLTTRAELVPPRNTTTND